MFIKKLLRRILYRIRGEYTTEDLIRRGLRVGKNFKRLNGVIIDPSHCWLINIGDNVTIGPRVHVLAHDASTKEYLDYTKIGRVNIGNYVFIGAESLILPNVTIGDNVVIGANSTVSRSLDPNGVYAGSPAKFICSIDQYLERMNALKADNPIYDESYKIGRISSEKKVSMIEDLDGKMGFIK